ncbi:DM13 domain-containing protein [Oceanospirillum beijerinckii]|uniref:DM13 domain-containing protein n=1 Tax=Oceanospirillum beijerinckii TaxID=64976 RepID=UPI00040AB2FE|nr:DM13 domain-containing protein [Oceanospirillum beijerinckii]
MNRIVFLVISHCVMIAIGFAGGIYALPILTAPPAPTTSEVQMLNQNAIFTAKFRRDLQGSDALHWGDGQVSIGKDTISLMGELAPGPDYKLYLSPDHVEAEADFLRLKSRMVKVADINTFDNFIVTVPASIDPTRYTSVIIWCETFEEFITSAKYQ